MTLGQPNGAHVHSDRRIVTLETGVLFKRDRLEVSILNDARYHLFSPRKKINTLAGGVFGVMVGVVIAFFLEWLESDVVRTTEDVERHVGVAVLAAIPAITSEEVAPVGARRKRRWAFLKSFK